jgi:hypothetical protein
MKKVLAVMFVCVSAVSTVAAQTGGPDDSSTVIVQMSYYAQPGKEDEVLRLRLLAVEVLVKRGLSRGKVWRSTDNPRATREPIGATVIWQGEFSNEAMLKRYEDVADNDPEFLAIRRQMGTVTVAARTERRYYREAR